MMGEPLYCWRCHTTMHVPDGKEPTDICNDCAHALLDKFHEALDIDGNVLLVAGPAVSADSVSELSEQKESQCESQSSFSVSSSSASEASRSPRGGPSESFPEQRPTAEAEAAQPAWCPHVGSPCSDHAFCHQRRTGADEWREWYRKESLAGNVRSLEEIEANRQRTSEASTNPGCLQVRRWRNRLREAAEGADWREVDGVRHEMTAYLARDGEECSDKAVHPTVEAVRRLNNPEPTHVARVPFKAVCGADKPNQHTVENPMVATCLECLRIEAAWTKLGGEQIAHLCDEARKETRTQTLDACVQFLRDEANAADTNGYKDCARALWFDRAATSISSWSPWKPREGCSETAEVDVERKAFLYGYDEACKDHGASFDCASAEDAFKRRWVRP